MASMEGDNLRLIQSVLGPACMLMGRAAKTAPAEANQGSRDAPESRARHARRHQRAPDLTDRVSGAWAGQPTPEWAA